MKRIIQNILWGALSVFCFCFFGWFSASRIAWVDIETEPAFLAAAADWVLGAPEDGGKAESQ